MAEKYLTVVYKLDEKSDVENLINHDNVVYIAKSNIVEELKKEIDNIKLVVHWFANRSVGTSSLAIAYYLQFGIFYYNNQDAPNDKYDFLRCVELLRYCPHLKSLLPRMREVNKKWDWFIDNWDYLESIKDDDVLDKLIRNRG